MNQFSAMSEAEISHNPSHKPPKMLKGTQKMEGRSSGKLYLIFGLPFKKWIVFKHIIFVHLE